MNFEKSFQDLGRRIRDEWRRRDFDELALPALAASAAKDFEVDFEFSVEELAQFFSRTSVRQQVSNTFSNLPITVYRETGFYIELLVWTQATTEIHEHAFSGAFKLLQGSSLHTRYAFHPEEQASLNVAAGDLETLGSEQLQAGDVREILPGTGGLLHSLYHLDTPSVTMVVRTPGLAGFQPQHVYYPPGYRIHSAFFKRDSTCQMMSKLFAVASQVEPEKLPELWFRQVRDLDFPRLAWLVLCSGLLDQLAQFQDSLEQRLLETHGARGRRLVEAMAERQRTKELIEARAVVADPELRHFLALLMNVRESALFFEQLRARFPKSCPVTKAAEMLTRLSTGKADTARLLASFAAESNMGAMSLGRRLEGVIPDELQSDAERERLFRALLEGERGNSLLELLRRTFPTVPIAELRAFVDRASQLPYLSVFLDAA
jgi:hypothetical protein